MKKFLTKREVDVVKLLFSGCTNAQMARNMGCSVKGIKHHITSINSKLKTKTRLQIVLWTLQWLEIDVDVRRLDKEARFNLEPEQRSIT